MTSPDWYDIWYTVRATLAIDRIELISSNKEDMTEINCMVKGHVNEDAFNRSLLCEGLNFKATIEHTSRSVHWLGSAVQQEVSNIIIPLS